ncbi:MAG: M16 family metallopeptidase, partial [Candidatus Polarisedimenticolia bacterium]
LLTAPPSGGAVPLAAPPAAAGFRIPAPARTVLKNGLTVLVLERRAIPLVQFRLGVKAGGTADPAGKEGTAALVARLLKRGTRTRPARQFAEEVEFTGGTTDVTAGLELTAITGEFASRDAEVAWNLLADMVVNPAFRPEEFEKEKRQQLASIVGSRDDPGTVASQAYAGWLFGTHPYGRPVEGTEASVGAITLADITGFYQGRFVPNNAVLVVVGDVDAAQTAQKAARYLGDWKRRTVADTRPPDPAPVKGRRVLLVDKPDATQSQIRLGNVGLRRADPEYFPALVANAILGSGFTSLLVDEVRVKRGLTYSIGSRVQALRGPGSVTIITFSKNETVVETIQASLEQVKRVRTGDLPGDALDKTRAFLVGLYPLRIESPEDLAAEILDVEFYGLGPDAINGYARRVTGVGPDAMKRAAARYLPHDDLALVVVGPAAALKKPLEEAFGPVTVRRLEAFLGP